jgi:hypothetical protein
MARHETTKPYASRHPRDLRQPAMSGHAARPAKKSACAAVRIQLPATEAPLMSPSSVNASG